MTVQISKGNSSPNIDGDYNITNISTGTKNTISNEVKTIQAFVFLLTKMANNASLTQKQDRGTIDPVRKFDDRFKKYASTLKTTYLDLAIKYDQSYKDTLAESELGRTGSDDIARFLRSISIGTLEKHKGNPIQALDELCKYFESKFFNDESVEKFEFDHGALRYFIYKQLVECNIFPNPSNYE